MCACELVRVLLVVVGRRIAVSRQWGLRLRLRGESLLKVVQDGEVGVDLAVGEAPGRVVEGGIVRRRFEVVTSVYDGTRDEVGVRLEDGGAVEGSRRKPVAVEQKGVVAYCVSRKRSASPRTGNQGEPTNGMGTSSPR